MKTGRPIQEMARLILGLVIVAAITIAVISTLRGPAPGSATAAASSNPTSSPQQTATPPQEPPTVLPYPYPMMIYPTTTPTAVGADKTVDAIVTQKFAFQETFQAITPSPTAPFTYPPTGASENGYDIASGQLLGVVVLNGWRGIWDGKPVGIYAGASSDDPDQGVIAVVINSGPFGNFPAPTRHGGVRVVSEQDNRLTLVSTDGTTYYFDIPAMSYVSSMTVFAPSITPPPTRTPSPPNYAIETSTPYPVP
jgi:hypothetical protein